MRIVFYFKRFIFSMNNNFMWFICLFFKLKSKYFRRDDRVYFIDCLVYKWIVSLFKKLIKLDFGFDRV